ncbi:MAG: 23S rRNA (pseudouridine(1915)-N(3))-methyltransferase RlmH, partial [Oscillospiraceae bacterium]
RMIAVGRLKERYLSDGCEEYQKRLGAFCKVQMIELDECRLPEQPGERLIRAALDGEADRILDKAKGSALIALCIEGEPCSSEQLAARLEKLAVGGTGTVSFVIGSSHGLSERVKQAAVWRMSMSQMTFPHQLARLMLCEQLYRAASISAGGKYHK